MSKTPGRAQPDKLINLIPVGLKEAALDSPTFRATTIHFADQVDLFEKWLEEYLKCTNRLIAEASSFETAASSFVSHSLLPTTVSEAVVDHDYSILAMRRCGEGMKDFWNCSIGVVKKLNATVMEPSRAFLYNDLRAFKDVRRNLELVQKNFDHLQAKLASQVKTKEPSSLREDAFQLHEARKSYLKLSMDYCVLAPQLRSAIDKLLIRIFRDQWRDMKKAREANGATFARGAQEMERIQGWIREMEDNEKTFKQVLDSARKQLEDAAEATSRPSRELEDYAVPRDPFGGHAASTGVESAMKSPRKEGIKLCEKQGWLNLRTFSGKPVRPVWIRRWAFVKHGIFGWLVLGSRGGGVEESERIGVLMCNVRPAVQEERRFCFEIKTKDNAIMLQADSQGELTEWISVIEHAKSKTLEEPASLTSNMGRAGHLDPAFAISPPSVPEFGALVLDSTSPSNKDDEPGASERNSAVAIGSDVDIGRKGNGLGHEGGGGLRDHAARAISKVDLPRKTSGHVTSGIPGSPATGGIASLIAASHSSMPIGPGAPVKAVDSESTKLNFTLAPRDMPPNTLAPSTLMNPPAPTQFSKQAVIISGDRGVGVLAAKNGGMPGGLLANVWGSWNWGYVNRLERGELKSPVDSRFLEPPSPLMLAVGTTIQRKGTSIAAEKTVPMGTSLTDLSIAHDRPNSQNVQPDRRTTLSLDTQTAEALRSSILQHQEYPSQYPLQLKTQDAQFRLLFPAASMDEKVVLVFRATWNPNSQQEFPGRAYVTTREIYFFSHHLGLVLASGVRLSNIEEVTAASGRDCDFLFLHLGESDDENVASRITIKTFLEPLGLLERRLNYLVKNSVANQPRDLESVIQNLIKMEGPKPRRHSSSEGWEDVSINTPVDNGTVGGHSRSLLNLTDLRAPLRVDGSLVSFDGNSGRRDAVKEAHKLRLPARPVVYKPVGDLFRAVDKIFDVSAKALFHVLFGDRSAVWQLLQHEHQATHLKQGPWASAGEGHLRRDFSFEIPIRHSFGQTKSVQVSDYQVVDVLNDHLCYVVTDKRTAWHLPYRRSFKMVSKLVITHVAKSKSRLAIFTKVEWVKNPWVGILKGVVDRHAMEDLELDALDLSDLVSDQIRRLGPRSRTREATAIFGHVGHSDASTQLQLERMAINIEMRRLPAQRTVIELLMQTLGSLVQTALTSLLDMAIDLFQLICKTCSANSFILALLVTSMLLNGFFTSRDSWSWWHERNATRFLARMGIQPNTVMSKAIYIHDIDIDMADLSTATVSPLSSSSSVTFETTNTNHTTSNNKNKNNCYTAFRTSHQPYQDHDLPDLAPTSKTSPLSRANSRIERSRLNIAIHRHDLLVALRMLNSMDRELVRAQWENWVVGETVKCRALARVLDRADQHGDGGEGGGQKGQGQGQGQGQEEKEKGGVQDEERELKRWVEEYCGSCLDERERLDGM